MRQTYNEKNTAPYKEHLMTLYGAAVIRTRLHEEVYGQVLTFCFQAAKSDTCCHIPLRFQDACLHNQI